MEEEVRHIENGTKKREVYVLGDIRVQQTVPINNIDGMRIRGFKKAFLEDLNPKEDAEWLITEGYKYQNFTGTPKAHFQIISNALDALERFCEANFKEDKFETKNNIS